MHKRDQLPPQHPQYARDLLDIVVWTCHYGMHMHGSHPTVQPDCEHAGAAMRKHIYHCSTVEQHAPLLLHAVEV
jgi:hypothetical protein